MGCFIPHRRQGWLPWVKQTGPLLLCDPFGDGSCIAAANDGTGLDCYTTKDLNKCGDPHLIYTDWGSWIGGIDGLPGFDCSECDSIYCELTEAAASMTLWLVPYNADAGISYWLIHTSVHEVFTQRNYDYTGNYFCYIDNNRDEQILCTISLDIWYFVYISFIDGKIYVRSKDNSILATTANSFIDNSVFDLRFGGGSPVAAGFDRLRLFNRSLSEAECEKLFFEYGDVA